MPSSRASASIAAVLRVKTELIVADVQGEVLGHPVVVEHATDGQADPVGAAQPVAFATYRLGDLRQLGLGGGEQLLALAGPFGGEQRIAAHHQPLAGKLRGGDLGKIAFIEQGELQRSLVHQGLDGWRPQRGDPVPPGRFQQALDAGFGDHAPITDQHHAAETKALLQFLDLTGQRCRIGEIALKHFYRNGTAIAGAQQPEQDLWPVALAIAAHMGGRSQGAFSLCHQRMLLLHQIRGLSPLRDPRPFPVLVSNSHTVVVHHDWNQYPACGGQGSGWARPICSSAVQAMSRSRSVHLDLPGLIKSR
jgi:hypothetical protein